MEISLGLILLPDLRSLNVPGEALVLSSLFLPEMAHQLDQRVSFSPSFKTTPAGDAIPPLLTI